MPPFRHPLQGKTTIKNDILQRHQSGLGAVRVSCQLAPQRHGRRAFQGDGGSASTRQSLDLNLFEWLPRAIPSSLAGIPAPALVETRILRLEATIDPTGLGMGVAWPFSHPMTVSRTRAEGFTREGTEKSNIRLRPMANYPFTPPLPGA